LAHARANETASPEQRKTTNRRAAVHWHLSEMADTGNIIGAEKSDEITLA
jgi:hypothetical protein